jgi:hypothetical protein
MRRHTFLLLLVAELRRIKADFGRIKTDSLHAILHIPYAFLGIKPNSTKNCLHRGSKCMIWHTSLYV